MCTSGTTVLVLVNESTNNIILTSVYYYYCILGSLYASLIDKNEAKSHCEHLSHDGFDVFGGTVSQLVLIERLTDNASFAGNSLGDAMSFQESCLNKYHSTIVSKIAVVFPKLAAFVKYGNM